MLLLYSFPIADSLWILEVSFLFRCPNVNTKKAISFVRLAGMNSGTSGQTLQNSIHKTVYDFFFFFKKLCVPGVSALQIQSIFFFFCICPLPSTPFSIFLLQVLALLLMKAVLAAFMSTRHKLESF